MSTTITFAKSRYHQPNFSKHLPCLTLPKYALTFYFLIEKDCPNLTCPFSLRIKRVAISRMELCSPLSRHNYLAAVDVSKFFIFSYFLFLFIFPFGFLFILFFKKVDSFLESGKSWLHHENASDWRHHIFLWW